MRTKSVRLTGILLAIGTALTPTVMAQADDPACPATSLPTELAGWARRQPLTAGTGSGDTDTPAMSVGQAANVALLPAGKVFFASPLGKALAPGDEGGLVAFRIVLTGTYRIALGAGAWVDVVRASKALPSVAHAHGPACTGIRKIVDFQLAPGVYLLQLSGTDAVSVPVMIVPLR